MTAKETDDGRRRPRRAGCALISRDLDEPMAGAAGRADAWVLVEHPGPWPSEAPEGIVPDEVLEHLEQPGVRVVLIRRPRSRTVTRPVCFVASTHPAGPWVRRIEVDTYDDLLAVDVTAAVAGDRPTQGETHDRPLVLVCTHGRRDVCCAELGRPLLPGMAARDDVDVWECTHVGGDRFAANVVLLPHGLHYSRLVDETAAAVLDAYVDGRVVSEHLRGRSAFSQPGQVAEHAVRQLTGITEIDGFEVLDESVSDDGTSARVEIRHRSETFVVRAERTPTPGAPTTHACVRGAEPARWSSWRAVTVVSPVAEPPTAGHGGILGA